MCWRPCAAPGALSRAIWRKRARLPDPDLIDRARVDHEGAEAGYLRLLDRFKSFAPESRSLSTRAEMRGFLSGPTGCSPTDIASVHGDDFRTDIS